MATTEELRQAFVAGAEWIIRRSTGRSLGYQTEYAKAEAEERYPSIQLRAEHTAKGKHTMEAFKRELTDLINRHSIENVVDMPDFLLSAIICQMIEAMGSIKKALDWHGCDSVCHPSNHVGTEDEGKQG